MKTWLHIFSILLLIASLWLVKTTLWPIVILSGTIFHAILSDKNVMRLVKRIIPIILLMSLFQVTFSKFYRDALLTWIHNGEYSAQILEYFIGSVARFAVPLIIFSKTSKHSTLRMNDALILARLLRFIGLPIEKFNLLILTIVRIIPTQQANMQSLEFTQKIFNNTNQSLSLSQKIRRMAIVLKAGIALSIRDAINIGDILALRHSKLIRNNTVLIDMYSISIWIILGLASFYLNIGLFSMWITISFWCTLTLLDARSV